jgi:hypothetical protein
MEIVAAGAVYPSKQVAVIPASAGTTALYIGQGYLPEFIPA